ncbi:hypothetical protein C8C83_2310 [Flavobacterium sp. 90]|uniref:hypothetical protein n=1 Tax=unclassified Flavobacterium TaxID=196869 RepID=UPI000EAD92C6|nr:MULTISPECIES: hypothetical protein [unclassified Flavobacterium]RKR10633.1 hypothetical protein C8C82_2615 [Flavobacterium sp. 81]TCK54416.1 hypothetical protein C8C83_2310 [Flavobacterium sp. 90]
MKKTILGLVLFLSLVSCSTGDSDSIGNGEAKEANMKVGFANSNTKKTGKDVLRNTLPVEIKSVIVTAVNGGVAQENVFNLVENGTIGAASDFILRNLKTGTSEFSVLTTSNVESAGWYQTAPVVENASESLNSVSQRLLNKTPSIVYKSKATITRNVVAGDNDAIQFELEPLNGRLISLFAFAEDLKGQGYTAKLFCGQISYVLGADPAWNFEWNKTPVAIDFTSEQIVSDYLCSGDKVNDGYFWTTNAGNGRTYRVEVYDAEGALVKITEFQVPYINGVSINNLYTITSDGMLDKSSTQSTFVITELNNLPFVTIDK